MKRICTLIVLLFSILLINNKSYSQDDFPTLEGPYLGQKPPGLIPEVFAPDIVWSEHVEGAVAFTPDLKKFYFRRRGGNIKIIRWLSFNTKIINGSSLLCHPEIDGAGL